MKIIDFFKREFNQLMVFGTMAWQKVLTYRISIAVYRVSDLVDMFILIFMWTLIYGQGTSLIKGYTLEEMITYVLMGGLFSTISFNLIHGSISRDIERGDLSLYLSKPVSYIKKEIYMELGAWVLNVFVSLFVRLAIIIFFLNKIIINLDIKVLLTIMLMLILTLFIETLIGVIIGMIAFWTEGEVGGFHNLASIFRRFFAGAYFPLSLLPASLSFIGFYLPFAYSFFIPAQIYLGKMDLNTAYKGILVQIVWIIILSILIKIIWKAGLKKYEAVGA